MTDRKLMQQALEAMKYADACLKKQLTAKTKHEYAQDLLMTAGTALRERLAQPDQINEFEPDWDAMAVMGEEQQRMAKRIEELEAQRKPLTDDRVWLEYMQLWPFRPNDEPTLAKDILRFARAIERAHGIKE